MIEFEDEKKMKGSIENACLGAQWYIDAFKAVDGLTDLFKMLHGVLAAANFINHRVNVPGLSLTEKKRLKDMAFMETLDHFSTALTNYCNCDGWADNNKKQTLAIKV